MNFGQPSAIITIVVAVADIIYQLTVIVIFVVIRVVIVIVYNLREMVNMLAKLLC